MKILFVASEVVPFAKTGGLADVAGSLPQALKRLGHQVCVAMPRYKQIRKVEYLTDLPVPMDGKLETAIIRTTQNDGVTVFLIDNYKFFYRDGGLYDHPDDGERFNFFNKAVLAMLPYVDFKPEIIHCNDWHTGPLPLYLKTKFEEEPFYREIATLFTIHNLQYQGRFPKSMLRVMSLGDEFFTPELLEYYGEVNYMKAGLLYADLLNTVSKQYAREIQTEEFGEGLDGLLRKRGIDLYGIVNGIDYQKFNPVTDPSIYHNYDLDHLEGKLENKRGLQRELNLPESDAPLLGITTRLAAQKGVDLLVAAIEDLVRMGVQLVVLGTGEDRLQKQLAAAKMRYPEQVSVTLGFDATLAQKIYAGADIFLMPSRFEPCGLGQLISFRYGTVPVVRQTGGLMDTVSEFNPATGEGNGFVFKNYQPSELVAAVRRALEIYRSRDLWLMLIRNNMQMDFSWKRSAQEYVQLYEKARKKRLESLLHAG
ncbi:MAG: glycogen synthase GlgA [Syntrophomonadaceae bacterium]|nr:glycogen synthase GlgA [Syntrophomonadaceae bacterium]